MRIVLYVVGGLVGLVVLFVVWSLWSVVRGGRRRDERLLRELDSVRRRLVTDDAGASEEITAAARKPELRYLLFALLEEHGHADRFPKEHLNIQSEAEASLAYWLMHPHELQDRPEQMELVEVQSRDTGGVEGRFFVFRYRMAEGHWAAKAGWLLGVSGPLFAGQSCYTKLAGAFSRADDREGTITPGGLVDWYVGMLRQKGMLPRPPSLPAQNSP